MQSTNGHSPRRAILYARVSTEEQAESGYSLSQQIEALREYVTCEGYEVLGEVRDPGQSGATLARPGMDRVRDLVAAGGVSVVLAQDRDRFARKPAYNYLLQEEFAEHGCELKALNDYGDDSPEGMLMRGIQDQFAEYERAKTAERTRRGRLRKAREGKIIANDQPNFGFRYTAGRDNYVVDAEQMQVIQRIFYMIGVKGVSIRGVKRAFELESLPTPEGKHNWATTFIRGCILNDVYKPHTYKEVKLLVSAEVAARLDPERRYGIWWYNRRQVVYSQVSEHSVGGKHYRQRAKRTMKPTEEWIAVPVPDSGISREWVDAARETIATNERTSKNGGRFWELSGGILRCASCGWSMRTNTTKSRRSDKHNYHYYRCRKLHSNAKGCSNHKTHRAEMVEDQVWGFISGLLKDPEALRRGLEEMIERERNRFQNDPEREAQALVNKMSEVERKRARFQDMAAEGLIDFDELRTKLAALEETRENTRRELAMLEGRLEHLAELERNRDSLMKRYAGMIPSALDALCPEERHRVYKLLKLSVDLHMDGTLEINGILGHGPEVCNTESMSGRSTRTRTMPSSTRRGTQDGTGTMSG